MTSAQHKQYIAAEQFRRSLLRSFIDPKTGKVRPNAI
jgi:hypothetical protein